MDSSSPKKNKRPRPPIIASTQSSSNFSFYKSESTIESDNEFNESKPRKPLKLEHESGSLQHDSISIYSPIQTSLPATQEEADRPAFQDASFDRLENSQDITWSPVHSDVEDSQISMPFLFDTVDIHKTKPIERAESVISDFSDDDNQNTKLSASSEPYFFSQPLCIEDTGDKDEVQSIISDFSNDDPLPVPTVNRQNTTLPPFHNKEKPQTAPVPVEFLIPGSKIPKPPLPRFRHLQASSDSKFVQLKNKGLADTALQMILNEKKLFDAWEYEINGLMAKYGSIVKVCQKEQICPLFRMTDAWLEGGLVFSWCVPLDQDKIVILDASQKNTQTDSFADMASQSTNWSFATPNYTIPDYEPSQVEDRSLYAFSFAYMHNVSQISIKKFVDNEQVVGIWPEWTEYNATLADYGTIKVKLVTKFKADSIY